MIAAGPILIGLAFGFMSGGRLVGLKTIKLRHEILLLLVFVVQAIARGRLAGTTPTIWGFVVWIGSSLVLIALLLRNRHVSGTLVAAGGVLLNLDVVVANGAMPVFVASSTSGLVQRASAGFYSVAASQTVFGWAGDVLRLDVLDQHFLLSPGDVLLGVGVAIVLARSLIPASSEAEVAGA